MSDRLDRETIGRLFDGAEIYVQAFDEDELMTLPEKMMLQEIEKAVDATRIWLDSAPVEPPVLSREITKETLDALINKLCDPLPESYDYMDSINSRRAMGIFRDAILESLSQEEE